MTSILVVGNCHLYGMQRSLRFFDSALRVEGCHIVELRQRFSDPSHFADHARGFDHLLTLPFGPEANAGFTVDDLIARHERVTVFPTVTFGAFHPDVVYVTRRDDGKTVLQSPLGPFHSALVYYGYCCGWTVDQTLSLFRSDVFGDLGYLSAWETSLQEAGRTQAAAAFDLPRMLVAAVRGGCFMHNPQHPRIDLVTAIARRAAAKMGLRLWRNDATAFLPDDLLTSHVWPVYPEIAEYYGFDGSYTFKRQSGLSRWPEFMTLEEFVQASFEMYGWQAEAEHGCNRVDSWLQHGTGPTPL